MLFRSDVAKCINLFYTHFFVTQLQANAMNFPCHLYQQHVRSEIFVLDFPIVYKWPAYYLNLLCMQQGLHAGTLAVGRKDSLKFYRKLSMQKLTTKISSRKMSGGNEKIIFRVNEN